MNVLRRGAAVALSFIVSIGAACSPHLAVGNDHHITCATKADCPGDFICDPGLGEEPGMGMCRAPDIPVLVAPALSISESPNDPTARPQDVALFTYVASDPNGPPYGQETIDIEAHFTLAAAPAGLDDSAWCPAAVAGGVGDDITGILAPAEGGVFVFAWDIAGDAAAGQCGLRREPTDTNGDGVIDGADQSRTAYVPAVTLRLRAVDSSDLIGDPVFSQTFALGNDPPIATLVPSSYTGDWTGPVPLEFAVNDSAGDPADVTIEFQAEIDTLWRSPAVDTGSTSALPPLPSANTYVVGWNTLIPLSTVQSDPQGIGARALGVRLHIRALDEPAPGVFHYGPWSDPPIEIFVRNQHPPLVDRVTLSEVPHGRGAGPLLVSYFVSDAEADTVDLQCHYSLDWTGAWKPCREFHGVRSEGWRDLESLPRGVSGGGVRHQFLWDTSAIHWGAPPPVAHLRLRASDGHEDNPVTGAEAVLQLNAPIGPRGTNMFASTPIAIPLPTAPRHILTLQLDGAGDLDFAAGGGDQVHAVTLDGIGTASFDATIASVTIPAPTLGTTIAVSGLDAFDVDGDPAGTPEIVAGITEDRFVLPDTGVLIAFALSGGVLTEVTKKNMTRPVIAIDHADFDGDGQLDAIVVNQSRPRTDDDAVAVVRVNSSNAFGIVWERTIFNCEDIPGVVAGDLYDQGDGLIEIAVPCLNQDTVRILQWDTSADTFFFLEEHVVGSAPTRIANADIDDDGLIDLLVTNRGNDTVSFLRALPGAGFAPATQFQQTASAQRVAAVDLDGDARPDIATLRRDDNSLGVTLQGDDPLFGLDNSFPLPGAPDDFAFADYNADGLQDVAVGIRVANGMPDNSILLSLSTPHGSFGLDAWTRVPVPVGLASTGIGVADFDLDGVNDLLVKRSTAPDIILLQGDGQTGTGTGLFRRIGVVGSSNTPLLLRVRDLNRDGFADAVAVVEDGADYAIVAWISGPESSLDLSEQSASLQVTPLQFASPTREPTRFDIADIDNDGGDDIVIVSRQSDAIHKAHIWLDGGGGDPLYDGHFAQDLAVAPDFDVGAQFGTPMPVAARDFDSDGNIDLVFGRKRASTPHRLNYYSGDGTGAFVGGPVTDLGDRAPTDLVAADVNDDGVMDMLVRSWDAQLVLVRFGGIDTTTGLFDGTFPAAGVLTFAAEPSTPLVADVTGDGLVDLIVGVRDPNDTNLAKVAVFANGNVDDLATGAFTRVRTITDLSGAVGLNAIDVQRDGLPDILAATPSSSDMTLFIGQNDQTRSSTELLLAIAPDPQSSVGPSLIAGSGDWTENTDRFDVPAAVPKISMRRLRVPADWSAGGDFTGVLRAAASTGTPLALAKRMEPITRAFAFSGDLAFVRRATNLPATNTCGHRWGIVPRFGRIGDPASGEPPIRLGLDTTASPASGFVLELPIVPARLDDAIATPDAIRVYRRSAELFRADDVFIDPITSDAYAEHYLAAVVRADGTCRDIFHPVYTWSDIPLAPGNDFAACSGDCFVIDATSQTVRVFTDVLGELQGYIVTVP